MNVGYKIPFVSRPLMSERVQPVRLPLDPEKREAIREAIATLLDKNVIVPLPPQKWSTPGFYSNLFLVDKWDGGFHPIFNVKQLNRHVHCPHFKMETVRSVRTAVQSGDWAVILDLSDAYLHVSIHAESYRYLRMAGSVKHFCESSTMLL